VNFGVHIDGRGGVEIGRDTALTPHVMVVTSWHHPDDEMADVYQPVRIGDHVLVNARAMILPGVEIGEGALVAAGSVVSKDVEPWTIVGGNPARPIGARSRQSYELGHWRPDWH
jgi:maltose O-acetyltransferase